MTDRISFCRADSRSSPPNKGVEGELLNAAHCKRVRPTLAKTGMLKGTFADFKNADMLEEIKLGSSVLKDSYQIRLQIYEAAKNGQQFYLTTTRKIDPKFMNVLQENGAFIRKPK